MPIRHLAKGLPATFGLRGAMAWDQAHTTPTAAEIGADPAGTAAAAIAAHLAASDPHPTYLTQTEGDARYEPLGVTVAPSYRAPSTLTVTAGTLAAGTVSDLAAPGGTLVDIEEVAATPAFDVEVVFASVTGTPIGFVWTGWYEGNTAHVVTVDAWNYTTSAWDNVGLAEHRTEKKSYSYLYARGTDYVSAGAAKFRFCHVSAGNTSHDLWLDYCAVVTIAAS